MIENMKNIKNIENIDWELKQYLKQKAIEESTQNALYDIIWEFTIFNWEKTHE